MHEQLIPASVLDKSTKLLFITHLAIGDFTYLQTFFKAFAAKHPHLSIDIWVDEVRRTRCFWKWKHLKKYVLFDWLATCPFFNKVYDKTYSPAVFKQSIREATKVNYDIIVSLSTIRSNDYIQYAIKINPKAFIVAIYCPLMWHEMTCRVVQKYLFKKINGTLPFPPPKDIHISDVYANWFESIFGMHLEAPARVPFINIPRKWILFAKLRLLKWNIDKKTNPFNKVIFINNYAKDNIRSWPLENVFELIKNIKKNDTWGDIIFLINTPPEYLLQVKKMYQKYSLTQTHIVSADLNFFQLPAYIAVSDLIISVETSTIHLAAALDKPVITLMRTKNPEWVPWDNGKITNIFCKHRPDWVKYIPLETVVEAVKNHDILKCLFKCMSKEPRQETFNLNVVNACGNQSANGKG